MKFVKWLYIVWVGFLLGCVPVASSPFPNGDGRVVPAEEFSRATQRGHAESFSIFRVADYYEEDRARLHNTAPSSNQIPEGELAGNPRYLNQGLKLYRTAVAPEANFTAGEQNYYNVASASLPQPIAPTAIPAVGLGAASFAPPASNPSLWPDSDNGDSLFRDFRAFQAMDLITIIVNDSNEGKKKAETDAERSMDLLAGISNFFGVETKDWAANNTALDPTKLIQANTTFEFEGEGETKRSGSLKARLSAIILEVLPNGLLRIEGTKIVAVNNEEEVMVISGLVRTRDIDAENQVDSSRIGNMRIDFYGRGIIDEQQAPGFLARVFSYIWPF